MSEKQNKTIEEKKEKQKSSFFQPVIQMCFHFIQKEKKDFFLKKKKKKTLVIFEFISDTSTAFDYCTWRQEVRKDALQSEKIW